MLTREILRYPLNAQKITRYKCQTDMILDLTGAEYYLRHINCGAEILSKIEDDALNPLYNEFIKTAIERGRLRMFRMELLNFGDWLPYTITYLRDTLGWQSKIIKKALAELVEIELVFNKPPEQVLHLFDEIIPDTKLIWLCLNVSKIQGYYDNYTDLSFEGKKQVKWNKPPAKVEHRKPQIGSQINIIIAWDRHINGFTNRRSYAKGDSTKGGRVLRIKNTLKAGYSLFDCLQAIVGHSLDEWWSNSTYKGVEYSLKERHIEKFIALANEKGATQAVIKAELEKLQAGHNSRYSKAFKERIAESKQKKKIKEVEKVVQANVEERRKYNAFAYSVAGFFGSGHSSSEIFRYCKDNKETQQLMVGIEVERFLIDSLKQVLSTYGIDFDRESETVTDFAQKICTFNKVQKINKGITNA